MEAVLPRHAAHGHRALLPSLAVAGLAATGLYGCRPHTAERAGAVAATPLPGVGPEAADAGYLSPPIATTAAAGPSGGLRVAGRSEAGAAIVLASPNGALLEARADRKGAWSVELPATERPQLYALSAQAGAADRATRMLHAEGGLLTTPGALAPALVLRAGFASLPLLALPAGGEAGPTLDAVDYDPGGFSAVAGVASPGETIALLIDGAPAAVGQADAAGRYALLPTGRRLTMATHRFTVQAGRGSVSRDVTLVKAGSLATPFEATPTTQGWRVEWALNGGGVQTTLVLAR